MLGKCSITKLHSQTLLVCLVETGSHGVAQARLELTILLP